MNGGKVTVPLAEVQEVWTDFTPTGNGMGGFEDHFGYYMPYVATQDPSTVVPKSLARQARSGDLSRFGSAFAAPAWPWAACFLVQLD